MKLLVNIDKILVMEIFLQATKVWAEMLAEAKLLQVYLSYYLLIYLWIWNRGYLHLRDN